MPTHEDNGHRAGFWDEYFGSTGNTKIPGDSTATRRAVPRRRAPSGPLPAARPAPWSRELLATIAGCALAIVVLFARAGWWTPLASTTVNFMNGAPALPLALILLAAVSLPCVLLHECGHALAASYRVGWASIRVSAIPDPRRPQGWCVYDATRATRTDTIIIALAGPAASALGVFFSLGLYRSSGSVGLWHDVAWALLAVNIEAVLLNLLPLRLTTGRKSSSSEIRLDGRVALDAVRRHR